jgi:uncharacterized repeat protein (TIGR01451 family)/LPXTG-motif cell wall-anchored protein
MLAPAVGNIHGIVKSGEPRLSISKSVRNITQGISFRNSVNANTNDRVEFEVIVTSTGTETASNVVLTDYFPSELWLDTNSVRVDNSYRSVSSNNFSISLGSMSANQQKRITFEATVNPNYTVTIRNLARASSSNTSSVEDDAYVFVTTTTIPGNPNIIRSKKVTNERTGQAGTSVSAQREDFLIYSLSTTNNGNGVSNGFVISDDLSGILPYADIVDLNGGTLNGNVITYPSLNFAVGETVIKTFRVRVKYHLAQNQSYSLQNTYGNLVTVTIPGGTTFVAPKTGSSATSAAVFAGLLTSGFVAYRKRRQIMSFIYV